MKRWWLVLLSACAPRIDPPVPPARPIVVVPESSAAMPWVDPLVLVKVEAAEQTSVLLFVDADCQGQPLRRDSAERFRAGIELEVVHGPNLFSAKAVDAQGLASSCSDPATLQVVKLARGTTQAPVVTRIEPTMPTQGLVATVFGIAPAGFRVRLWSRPQCQGALLATGAGFGIKGLTVALERNERLEVSLDGVRGTELTLCSTPHVLANDLTPPPEVDTVAIPTELSSQQEEHFLIVTNDFEATDAYAVGYGDRCPTQGQAPSAGINRVCAGVAGSVCQRILEMPPLPSPNLWVWRVDPAGNSSCTIVNGRPTRVGSPPPLSTLRVSGGPSDNLYALTAQLESGVLYFPSRDCRELPSFADLQPTPTLYVKVGVLSGSPWSARLWNSVAPDAGTCEVVH